MGRSSRIVVMCLVAGSTALMGCGTDEDDTKGSSEKALADGVINGHVKEWEVVLETDEVPAGEITFSIENQGSIEHEFLVAQTDIDLGQIPLEGDRFSEEQEGLLMIDEIPEYAAGTTEELTVTLEPGTYQLVCNIAGHYQAGMFTKLTVV